MGSDGGDGFGVRFMGRDGWLERVVVARDMPSFPVMWRGEENVIDREVNN